MSDKHSYDLSQFQQHPNLLAQHYQHFGVADRLLFTGHSHQAWPDCGFQAQQQAWLDAAARVDDKWDLAAVKANELQKGFADLLDDKEGHIALGQNTFELVIRFLSALALRKRPRLITSANEFHTLRRLLGRLEEEGVDIVRVPSQPFDSFPERLAAEIDDTTAAVLCSHVFFDSSVMAGNFAPVAKTCERFGCELLVDAYHSVNVAPFSIVEQGLEQAFVVGGGYKYCQLGEGNCFLRVPKDCQMRPVATGWYCEFEQLAQAPAKQTLYASGAARFAGSTYDPTSHYRAADVLQFFRRQGLTPDLLRQISQHQIGLMIEKFQALDLDTNVIALKDNVDLACRAGFLAFQTPKAEQIYLKLKECGVLTDHRGETLRFGPAPYLSDQQINEAMGRLQDTINILK